MGQFLLTQGDVNAFGIIVTASVFALLGFVSLRFSEHQPLLRRRLLIVVGALSIAIGLLAHNRLAIRANHVPINAVEVVAFAIGIAVTTILILVVLVVPVPGYKPAYVRIGLALIVGAIVLTTTSFIAHEFILRKEGQRLPYGYICMAVRKSTGSLCGRNDTYVGFEANVPTWLEAIPVTHFSMGRSDIVSVLVRSSNRPGSDIPEASQPLTVIGQRVPACKLSLTATLVAPAFDVVKGESDPVTVFPRQSNLQQWTWLITPKADGLQLVYFHVGYEVGGSSFKTCSKSRKGAAYDRSAYYYVAPSFLTLEGIPQWLAFMATVLGIVSTTFGMLKKSG